MSKDIKRKYVYHKNNWFYSMLSIAMLVVSFTPGLVGHNHVLSDIAKDPLSTLGIFAFLWAFFLLYNLVITAITEPYYSRPIEVDEEGIRSYMRGKVFREIKWDKVTRIRVPWALYFPYVKGYGEMQIVFTVYSEDGTKIDFFNDILYNNWRGISELSEQFGFAEIVYYIFKHVNVGEVEIAEYRDKFYLFPFFKGKRITKVYKGYPSWWETLMKYVKERGIDKKISGKDTDTFNTDEKKEIKDDLARLRKMFGE